jgi:hypothetical protein
MSATLAAAFFIVALAGQQAAPPVQDPAPAPGPPPRKLEVTFDTQGRVTIVAQQVTVSEILAEGGRKGGTKIQGAERLTGGVLVTPMLFDNRPELEVIEALTRQAAGVSVAPRRAGATGASRFESIHIVATSAATAASPYPSAPTYGGTAPPPVRGFPDDEVPPVNAPGARDPQQQPGQGPAGAKPAPSSPTGSPVIVPVVPVVPVGGTPPPGGRGGGTPPPTTTGRGGGGGGGGR